MNNLHDVLYLIPLSTINSEITGQGDQIYINSPKETVIKRGANAYMAKTLKTQSTILHKGI